MKGRFFSRLALPLLLVLAVAVGVGCKQKAPNAPAPKATAPKAAAHPPVADANAPNILLISIDALRADRLSCYGLDRPTSPNVDALAAEATRFAHAHANAPWTLPSHATMLTGQEVGVHGMDHGSVTLNPTAATLATALRARGYATAGVVTAPYLQSSWGFNHGFDSYDDGLAAPDYETSHHLKTAELAVNRALEAVRERHGKPWFVFLHLFDVHHDYVPPPAFRKLFVDPSYHGHFDVTNWEGNFGVHVGMDPADFAYVLAQYDGGVAWVDSQLGRLFAGLKADGEWARTAVIFTADHGDEFLEHGNHGHGQNLFDELLHVPLIVKAPNLGDTNRVQQNTIETPVSLVDIFATVLEWGGASLADYRGSGQSFLPLLRGAAGAAHNSDRALFAETNFARIAPGGTRGHEAMVEKGGWKYVERRDAPGRRLLFHVTVDPGDRVDRLANEPAKAAELQALLADHLRANHAMREDLKMARAQPVDAKTAEQLKQLGYVNN